MDIDLKSNKDFMLINQLIENFRNISRDEQLKLLGMSELMAMENLKNRD